MGARLAKLRSVSRTPTASLKNVDKVLEEKIISPRHATTVKAFDELVKQHPEFEDSAKQKNEQLHDMLNSVRVDSTGGPPTEVLRSGKRSRQLKRPREGKLTNEQISDLFMNKKIDPELFTVEKTAEHYKLDPEVAKNLLQNFSSFYIYKEEKAAMTMGDGKTFFDKDTDGPN